MTKKYVGMFYPTQCIQSFDDDMFFKMFRFRRELFYQVLTAMNLDGSKSRADGASWLREAGTLRSARAPLSLSAGSSGQSVVATTGSLEQRDGS